MFKEQELIEGHQESAKYSPEAAAVISQIESYKTEKHPSCHLDAEYILGIILDAVHQVPAEKQSQLRRELLDYFKKEYIRQRLAFAHTMVEMEKIFDKEKCPSRDELSEIIDQFAQQYHLSSYELTTLHRAATTHLRKKRILEKYITDYQARFSEKDEMGQDVWPQKFFEDLTGHPPKGKIAVKITGHIIYFLCSETRDYLDLIGADKERYVTSGAAMITTGVNPKIKPGLIGSIAAVNLSQVPSFGAVENSEEFEGTLQHEKAHRQFQILYPALLELDETAVMGKHSRYKDWGEYLTNLSRRSRPEQITEAVNNEIDSKITEFKVMAKDEILAHLSEKMEIEPGGPINLLERIIRRAQVPQVFAERGLKPYHQVILEKTKNYLIADKGVYDYFEDFNLSEFVQYVLEMCCKQRYPELVEKIIKEKKEEYKRIIETACQAIGEAAEFYKHGEEPELVALFFTERLDKWPRLARLLREFKKS